MSPTESDHRRRIEGEWWNQLGSRMVLTTDEHGGLTGTYHSRVGGVPRDYILAGRFDVNAPANGVGVTIGWAVTFFERADPPRPAIHTTTTWDGQFFDDTDPNKQTILTHWLLSRSMARKHFWNSTNIGNDVFTRPRIGPPLPLNEIERSMASVFACPHVEDIVDCYHSNIAGTS